MKLPTVISPDFLSSLTPLNVVIDLSRTKLCIQQVVSICQPGVVGGGEAESVEVKHLLHNNQTRVKDVFANLLFRVLI